MAMTLDKFLLDRARIFELLRLNRGYVQELGSGVDGLERGVRGKFAAFWGLLYENLKRGDKRERALELSIRPLPMEDRIRVLRSALVWLSDVVRYGRRSAKGYAQLVIFEFDLRGRVNDVRKRVGELEVAIERRPVLTDEELLDRAIELKEGERDFVSVSATFFDDLAKSFEEVGLTDWAPRARGLHKRALDFYERILRWLDELRKMKPPPPVELWRLHCSHMWYRSYKARETPDPYAMVSVFVYTRRKDKYKEWMFESALDFLERRGKFEDYEMMHPEEPSAFPTFHAAEIGASKAAVRKGFVAPGAYYEVEGWEFPRQVDEDEKGDYEEDEWRYYVCFYRTRGNKVEIYREYYGKLEPVMVIRSKTTKETKPITWDEYLTRTLTEDEEIVILSWKIYAEDKSEPIWKRTEELGWPDVLKP